MSAPDSDATMAVFLDLENIAIGASEAQFPAFDIRNLLIEENFNFPDPISPVFGAVLPGDANSKRLQG